MASPVPRGGANPGWEVGVGGGWQRQWTWTWSPSQGNYRIGGGLRSRLVARQAGSYGLGRWYQFWPLQSPSWWANVCDWGSEGWRAWQINASWRETEVSGSHEPSWEFAMLKGWFYVKRGKCLNSSSGGFPEFFFCCFSPIPSPPISPPLLSLPSLSSSLLMGKAWPPSWVMPTGKKSMVTSFSNLRGYHELDNGEGNGNLLQYSCLRNPMDRGA